MSADEMIRTSVILLSGRSRKPDALLRGFDVSCKALVRLPDGRSMLDAILGAFTRCPRIGSVVVVGPPEVRETVERFDAELVPRAGRLVDNLLAGFEALNWPQRCLVATADIPLISPEGIEDFLCQATSADADVVYPIVSREVSERTFPGARRTYATLRDGTFTGGNVLLMEGELVRAQKETMQSVFDSRKSPLRLCGILGIGFVLRFLTRRLSLREVEDRVGRLFHCTARALVLHRPEISFDVDKLEDWEAVLRRLGGSTPEPA